METKTEETTMNEIEVNGVKYVPADSVRAAPAGNRAVVIIDRGWIYAGDVTEANGRIRLSRCVWVFRWQSCGFAAVVDDPSRADIRPHADIDIPAGAEIFRVPVAEDWGL